MTERLRLDRKGVSLGVMLAVVLLTVQGFIINRAAGINYPVWAPRQT